ncbi:MAG: proteasome-activating nucleotidase [Candidatus Woesearchaeota archaeon]
MKSKTEKESKNNNIVDSLMYNYSTTQSDLEEENRLLRQTINNLKQELDRMTSTPLLVSEVKEVRGDNAIIRLQNGNAFLVNISKEAKKISAGDQVLVEQKNLNIIRKVNTSKKFDVEKYVIIEKPQISWDDVGGLEKEAEEIKEVIELPLKKPELFKKIGITPPKGILLYGPPGTGKTLLAKAVASSTHATFIEIVGSELVQKFIGEGAKLVKEIFEIAKAKSPSIIFIDELDAIAATRVEIGTSGEREVQRTFMQLLAEIDGFKPLGNVKVIGCTNRRDILDPAILRPGRLDRLIKVDIPNKKGRHQILKIHTKDMNLMKDVNLDTISEKLEGFSGAEIKAVCTEAGYEAIRKNLTKISKKNFEHGIKRVQEEERTDHDDYMNMFG